MIRLLKVLLMVSVAFLCVMYAIQNIVNLQAAYGFVALMVGMEGHDAYAAHFGPAVSSPIVIWLMLWIIIALEFLAGGLAAKGALDLWQARNADATTFNGSKTYAILGCGVAVLLWFGIFSAIGGAYFQMWQTPAGDTALHGSFWYSMQNGLILLIVNANDK